MLLFRVLTISGRKVRSEDIRVLTLTVLKRTSEKFLRYYHYEKPHRGLTQKEDGTRSPGILRDHRRKSLIHIPKRFTLDEYTDSRGHLNLPLARGKVSFVGRVDSYGRIEVNGSSYFISCTQSISRHPPSSLISQCSLWLKCCIKLLFTLSSVQSLLP